MLVLDWKLEKKRLVMVSQGDFLFASKEGIC